MNLLYIDCLIQIKESKINKKEELNQATSNKVNKNIHLKELHKNQISRLEPKENNSNAKQVIDLQYKEYDTLKQVKTEQLSDKDSVKHGKI